MHPGVTQCVQRSHLASVKQWTPGRVLRFRLGRSGVFERFRSVSQKETAESRRGSRVVGEGVTAKRRERERRKKTEFARVCVCSDQLRDSVQVFVVWIHVALNDGMA